MWVRSESEHSPRWCEMEKLVMRRINQDFVVFMRQNYPQVADEQFEFEILKAEDNEEEEDE